MFISCSLYCNVIKYAVVDSGINLSDHVPVKCVIAFQSGVGNNSDMSNKKNNPNKKLCNILRWDKGDANMYYYITGLHLQNLQLLYHLLSCNCDVCNCCHRADINKYYNDIIDVMIFAAKCTIPSVCSSNSKAYWNSELQQLKEDSVQAHLGWKAIGKLRHGWLNSFRLHCKYKYKLALKNAILAFEWDLDDELSQLYLWKDIDNFWKKWQKRFFLKEILLHLILEAIQSFTILQNFLNRLFLMLVLILTFSK